MASERQQQTGMAGTRREGALADGGLGGWEALRCNTWTHVGRTRCARGRTRVRVRILQPRKMQDTLP
jgi:hypothetical protein